MRISPVIVLGIVLVVEAATVSTNARCGSTNGMTCLGSKWGSCCSQHGWCGSTNDYCSGGCQSGFGTCSGSPNPTSISMSRVTLRSSTRSTTPSPSQVPVSNNGRCGASYGRQTCQGSSYGDCCSQSNYCGKTNAYCSIGCQSAFGICIVSSLSADRPSTSNSRFSTIRSSSTSSPPARPSTTRSYTVPASSVSSHASSPSVAQPVSKNARCGAGFGGQTCQGSRWGNCCSQYFYCGSTYDYCGRHSCQKGYGKCDSSSSSVKPSSSKHFSSVVQTSSASPSTSSDIFISSTSSSVEPTPSSSSVVSSSSSEIEISSAVSPSSSEIIISSSTTEASSSVEPTPSSSEILSSSVSATPSSSEIVSSTVVSSTIPSVSAFPTGVNVLSNPGFEEITGSGPAGAIIDWEASGGRVYPNRFQAAAQEGTTYAILHYLADDPPTFYQTRTGFDASRPYALTFYWNLHSIVQTNACTLSVSFGNVVVYTVVVTVADDPRPYNWKGPFTTTPITPSALTETLRFDYVCVTSGNPNAYSYIFLDNLSLVSV